MGQSQAQPQEKPKPGDLIEIKRRDGIPYEHWALYVAENEVIHVTRTSKKGVIRREKLDKVVGTDQWSVNNSLDKKYDPKDVQFILKVAEEMEGKEVDYDLFKKNCEHMVTDWRYGQPTSVQVEMFILGMLLTGMMILGLSGGLSAYLVKKRQRGHRRSIPAAKEEDETEYAYARPQYATASLGHYARR